MTELLIIITNLGLILVTLALTVVTAADNKALIRTVQILATQRKSRKARKSTPRVNRHTAYTPRHSA